MKAIWWTFVVLSLFNAAVWLFGYFGADNVNSRALFMVIGAGSFIVIEVVLLVLALVAKFIVRRLCR